MSVSPHDPGNLPLHRRPVAYGGTGKDPVWRIIEDGLGPTLSYRPDPADPDGQGFVEPAFPMPFEQYQRCFEATAASWERLDELPPVPLPAGW